MSSSIRATALALAVLLLAPALVAQRQTRTLFIKAVDQSGAPVPNLTAADFEVKEGDATRTITSAALANGPMRVMILVDTGSALDTFAAQIKTALTDMVDGIPAPHEVGIISLGRQARVRIQPTTDRAKLRDIVTKFPLDGGGVAFLDGLRDTEERFQKKPGVRWPVYVMLVADENEASGNMQTEELNKIMLDMVTRATTVHAAILEKMGPTAATQVARTLASNTGGLMERITTPAALPDQIKRIAARIMADFNTMSTSYQIEYVSDAKYKGSVDAGVVKSGLRSTLSLRRPS
jgi:hypothetical protein